VAGVPTNKNAVFFWNGKQEKQLLDYFSFFFQLAPFQRLIAARLGNPIRSSQVPGILVLCLACGLEKQIEK
jgi:hypothetical protein